MEQVKLQTTEGNARTFAAITHSARELAEFMEKPFLVRIKNNRISEKLGWSVYEKEDVKLLGKIVEMRVKWSHSFVDKYFPLVAVNDDNIRILLTEGEFRDVITQRGPVLAQFKIWEQYVASQKVSQRETTTNW